jgi:NADPH:quinone reductase
MMDPHPRMMRAVVIPRYGEADVLEIRELPVPRVQDREVLVKVAAAGLNRADILQRRGRYPAPPGSPAEVPGLELAGEVVTAAPDAARFLPGDRVFGITGGGAQAGFVAVDERQLARIPKRLGWAEAAAVPEAYITAHDALVTQADFREGDRVLINAAGSGVGVAAIQIIRALGGMSFGSSRTARKVERCLSIGMDAGIVLSGDPSPLVDAVSKWTAGAGVDIVLDLVGGPYVGVGVTCLARRGRLICIGTIAGREATIPLGQLLAKRLRVFGTVLRSRSTEEKAGVVSAFEADLLPLLQGGALRPIVDAALPVERVVDAHRLLESDSTFGKVILTFD